MKPTMEITLDFDHSVGTEDRFKIKHFIQNFVEIVNNQSHEELNDMISNSAIAEGFSEFTMQKSEFLDMFYKKFFGRRHNFIRFPNLKLTMNKNLYIINGEYEEYVEEILTTAGSLQMSLIKSDDDFEFISFKFFPRMRMQLEGEQYD